MRKGPIAVALSAAIVCAALLALRYFSARGRPPPSPPEQLEAEDTRRVKASDPVEAVPASGAVSPKLRGADDARRAGLEVSGRVLGVDGAPAPGVLLEATPAPGWSARVGPRNPAAEAPAPRRARTDDRGAFAVEGLEPGTHRLTARGPGSAARVLVRAGDSGIDVVLEETSRITGQVRLADHRSPVVKARIVATPAEDASRLEPGDLLAAETDGAGRFAIEGVEPGVYDLHASGGGARPRVIGGVRAGGDGAEPVEILLEPGLEITGRVLGEDGAPLSGCEVRILHQHWDTAGPPTTTDADGRFSFGGLAPGECLVMTGGRPPFAGGSLGPIEAPASDVRLILPRGSLVSGRVLDAATGRPVPGARASIQGSVERNSEDVRAGDDGTFAFALRGSGSIGLVVSAPGFRPARFENIAFGPGKPAAEIEALLERAGAASGTVRDASGSPVSGARILFFGDTEEAATSAADGSFAVTLENLQPGTIQIDARHPDFYLEERLSFTLADLAQGVEGIEIVLRRCGSIAGTVSAERGRPGRLEVLVFEETPPDPGAGGPEAGEAAPEPRRSFIAAAALAPGGGYRAPGLRPGAYRLFARAGGCAPHESGLIEVREGSESRHDILLEAGGTIAGRVTDTMGRAVADAAVTALRDGSKEPRVSRTDLDGRYRLESLRAGPHTVRLEKAGHAPAVLAAVATGEERADAVLHAAGALEARIGDAATGETVPLFDVRLIPEEGGLPARRWRGDPAGGSVRLDDVAPGEYRFLVWAPGYLPHASGVRVLEGETARVEALLERGNEVRGVVADARGLPVEGAEVRAVRLVERRALATGAEGAPPAAASASPEALPDLVPLEDPVARAPATAGGDGTFVISGLEDGTYRIEARHEDRGAGTTAPMAIQGGRPSPGIRVVLESPR